MTTYTTSTEAVTIGQVLSTIYDVPITSEVSKINVELDEIESTDTCQKCKGLESCQYEGHRGFRRVITERGTALEECPYLLQWKIAKQYDNLFRQSNLGKSYHGLTFKRLQGERGELSRWRQANQKQIQRIRQSVTKRENMYIYGESGSGKTLMLSLIGNEYLMQNKPVYYSTAPEMMLQLRYNSEECETRLKWFIETPILLLDELGNERSNEYSEEQLYLVLEGRKRHNRKTIIASEKRAEETRYPERIKARLKQEATTVKLETT